MWSILGIILVAFIVVILEVPNMLKKNLKKELWTFSILLLIGVSLGILESLNIDIPNPADLITIIYQPITDMIFNFLE